MVIEPLTPEQIQRLCKRPHLEALPLPHLKQLAERDRDGEYGGDGYYETDLAIAWELYDRLLDGTLKEDGPLCVEAKRRLNPQDFVDYLKRKANEKV
jgi:hypothetical protein